MKMEEVSRVLWIKTLEEYDTKGEILPYFVRDTQKVERLDAESFDARACALMQWLSNSKFSRLSHLPPVQRLFLNRPLLIFLALFLGAVLNLLGDQHRIQLLLNPFLFLWLWNFVLFIVLVFFTLFRKKTIEVSPSFFIHLLNRAARWQWLPLRIQLQMKFLGEWGTRCPGLLKKYMKQGFHLGALCILFGAIAGLYLRGFLINYTFVWESTFLASPQSLQDFLDVFFAPASVLIGIPIPILPNQGVDMPGDQWIHLFAMSSLLYVGIPRILLLISGFVNTGKNLDLPLSEPYFQQWIVDAPTWILTYGMQLDSAQNKEIHRLLGVKGSITSSMVPWGESLETKFKLLNSGSALDRNHRVFVVFNGIQTPEYEIHGIALAGTQDVDLQVLLFNDPEGQEMSQERVELWKHLFSDAGIDRIRIISHSPETHLVEVEL